MASEISEAILLLYLIFILLYNRLENTLSIVSAQVA